MKEAKTPSARQTMMQMIRQAKKAAKNKREKNREIGLLPSAYVDWQKELALYVEASKSLPPPVLEYVFHPSRKWRFDLAWPDGRFAVEIQGGVYHQGRHTRGDGYTNDCEKLAEAVCLGWRVIYVTTEQIKNGQALAWIERILIPKKDSQQPSPKGEGL